jgi:hypothetical protein
MCNLNLLNTSHKILQSRHYTVCDVQSTVHDTVPQFQDLFTFRQHILACLPPLVSGVVVKKLKNLRILSEGSIYCVKFDKNYLSAIVFRFSVSTAVNCFTTLNNRPQCLFCPVGLYLIRAVV